MNLIKQLFYILLLIVVIYIGFNYILFPVYTRLGTEIELADITKGHGVGTPFIIASKDPF